MCLKSACSLTTELEESEHRFVFKTGRFRKLSKFPKPQFRNVKGHLKIPTYLDSPREGEVSKGRFSLR